MSGNMKKLLGILVLGLLLSGNAYAFCLFNCKTPGLIFSVFDEDDTSLSNFDPSSSGCVYNGLGQKVKCVSYKYNDSKKPGSFAKAQSKCIKYLKKYKKEGYTLEGCI